MDETTTVAVAEEASVVVAAAGTESRSHFRGAPLPSTLLQENKNYLLNCCSVVVSPAVCLCFSVAWFLPVPRSCIVSYPS